MKSFLLATAATIALCTNAVAADPGHNGMNQTQMEPRQSGQTINPSDLSQRQISLIQRELNDQGFTAGKVDGVWGPGTRQAMRSFQKQRNLSTDQPLNQETLSALGVDLSGDNGPGNAGTTGSGGGRMDQPAPGR